MNPLDSLGRSIKNIFVGSHRGEDFILENLEKTNKKEDTVPKNQNDMGVNPNEWFDNPLDSVHGDTSFGHESEDQNESVVGRGIEAPSLECLGCVPREKDEITGNADIGG